MVVTLWVWCVSVALWVWHSVSQTQFGSVDVESNAQHDAYLERMKAEAEDRDSEDGGDQEGSAVWGLLTCVCSVLWGVPVCVGGPRWGMLACVGLCGVCLPVWVGLCGACTHVWVGLCRVCLPVWVGRAHLCGCCSGEVPCCVIVCVQRTQTLWLEIAVRMTWSELSVSCDSHVTFK